MTPSRLSLASILRLAALALLPLLAGLDFGHDTSASDKESARAALAAERARCAVATIPCTDDTLIVADGRIR